MSVAAVARKDFQDAVRSRALLILAFAFVLSFVLAAYAFTHSPAAHSRQTKLEIMLGIRLSHASDAFLPSLSRIAGMVVPLIGVIAAYASVIGEREAGTLKLLLTLPHSRLDVVVGKVLGRSAVVGLPIVIGSSAAMLVFPLNSVSLGVSNFVLFALLTAVLGLTFIAVAVGVSAAVSTYRRAVAGSVGLYFLFAIIWEPLVDTLFDRYLQQSDSLMRFFESLNLTGVDLLSAKLFVKHLSPILAYQSLANRIIVNDAALARAMTVPPLQGQFFLRGTGGSVPFYLSDIAVILYLIVWIAGPPALGYYIFEQADI